MLPLYSLMLGLLALLVGWLFGMIIGTVLFIAANNAAVYKVSLGGFSIQLYSAVTALIVNLVIVGILTLILNAAHVASGKDVTQIEDYKEEVREPAAALDV